jgi:hypothetical protein
VRLDFLSYTALLMRHFITASSTRGTFSTTSWSLISLIIDFFRASSVLSHVASGSVSRSSVAFFAVML